MKLNDFLKPELLGTKFLAIRSYTEVLDRDTKKITGYKINVSLQSESSDFYMELIPVKIKNISPTLSVETLKNNKSVPVILENLQFGVYDNNLWFNATDMLPATNIK